MSGLFWFWTVVGVALLGLAVIGPRRVWWAMVAWRYRNPEQVEPSDVGYAVDRVVAVLGAVVAIAVAIISVAVAQQDTENHQAEARASAQESQAESGYEELDSTAQGILTTIYGHTPPGGNPRTIPLSEVPTWDSGLQANYRLTPTDSYASTGQFRLSNTSSGASGCVTVADHVPAPDEQAVSPVGALSGPCT